MSYKVDLVQAARRHLEAAGELDSGKRYDVAGYLYGLAAECAVKALMSTAGFVRRSEIRNDDPYWAHFPDLLTLLRDHLNTRRSSSLYTRIHQPTFMHNWSIRMRYSDGTTIQKAWVQSWKAQAKDIVTVMNSEVS